MEDGNAPAGETDSGERIQGGRFKICGIDGVKPSVLLLRSDLAAYL